MLRAAGVARPVSLESDWPAVARHVTNEFRLLNYANEGSPAFQQLLARLLEDPDFRRLWNEGAVEEFGSETGCFALEVPGADLMTFELTAMIPADRSRSISSRCSLRTHGRATRFSGLSDIGILPEASGQVKGGTPSASRE